MQPVHIYWNSSTRGLCCTKYFMLRRERNCVCGECVGNVGGECGGPEGVDGIIELPARRPALLYLFLITI